MRNEILFSVIVPVYNVEPFLKQCVNSILAQTYKNFEMILVDDGSPDNCGKICDEYAQLDKRVKVIHKENGGVTSARKEGLAIAKGDYIAFVDADDRVDKDYLLEFAAVLTNYNVDMVCCGYNMVKGNNVKQYPMKYDYGYYDRQRIEKEIFPSLIQSKDVKYFPHSLWTNIYKKKLLENIFSTFPDDIKVGEDLACVISCVYNSGSLYILHKYLYFYNINDQSITNGKKVFPWNGPKLIFDYLSKNIDLNLLDFREQLWRQAEHELFGVVVTQFYRNESYSAIVQDIENHLNEDFFNQVIQNANFKGNIKAWLMHNALKYRWYWLIKLYAKVK